MNTELETLLRQVVPNPHGLIDIPAFADKIDEMFKDKQYSHLEMEAGLCVWECLIEWTLHDEISKNHQDWVELRGAVGSVELRHQSIVIGKWCLKVYDICTKHDPEFFAGVAYDWEVIPMILGYARNREGEPVIYEHDLPAAEKVALFVTQEHLFNEFVTSCKHEARTQWSYTELVTDDDGVRMRQAFELGEEPAEFVKWLGEKYDLIPTADCR